MNSRFLISLRTRGRAFKRYRQPTLVIAFIIFACLSPFRVIEFIAAAALAIMAASCMKGFVSVPAAQQAGYLKTFVKQPRVQQVVVAVFAAFVLQFGVTMARYIAAGAPMLFVPQGAFSYNGGPRTPFGQIALYLAPGTHQILAFTETEPSGDWSTGGRPIEQLGFDFTYLAFPPLIYALCSLLAINWRARLKTQPNDPDLILQRRMWTSLVYPMFSLAFVASVLSIAVYPGAPVLSVCGWFAEAACDAGIFRYSPEIEPQLASFRTFSVLLVSAVVTTLFLPQALKFAASMTSACWRVVSQWSLQNLIEACLEAFRLPSQSLTLREAYPFWVNAFKSLLWLGACYGALFWFFGLCGGALGDAVSNWMMASAIDAGFHQVPGTGPYEPMNGSLRLFLGSIVALYATVPFAVMASVFLPYKKPRRILINSDGILLNQGPYWSLQFRAFRLWSDLKSMSSVGNKTLGISETCFVITFHSGGELRFYARQMPTKDLKTLLNAIDEHATNCTVAPDVWKALEQLDEIEAKELAAEPDPDEIESAPPGTFKSTVFVPHAPGEQICGNTMRIVKQLASKPLCAVYLARMSTGRLAIVKQFYLADDNEETKAVEKLYRREFELLLAVDHPGISKVLGTMQFGDYTYLVIEHRPGSDLRSVVNEHGSRSEGLTIAWAKQLCQIMTYLHERTPPIIHRDLAPDNIVAGDDGQLRLIDFGAAREFLEGISGTMIGKQCYMAPEQIRGEASPRSDIYSFGGTLFFLLTGRDPVALKQMSPAQTCDCSESLDELVRDCMSFEEAQRPQSFREVLERLNNIDQGVFVNIKRQKSEVAG